MLDLKYYDKSLVLFEVLRTRFPKDDTYKVWILNVLFTSGQYEKVVSIGEDFLKSSNHLLVVYLMQEAKKKLESGSSVNEIIK